MTARQVASRDITEDCREERKKLRISPADPMGPQNCLPFEKDICESLGIVKGDFRQYNGGLNKKNHSKTTQ